MSADSHWSVPRKGRRAAMFWTPLARVVTINSVEDMAIGYGTRNRSSKTSVVVVVESDGTPIVGAADKTWDLVLDLTFPQATLRSRRKVISWPEDKEPRERPSSPKPAVQSQAKTRPSKNLGIAGDQVPRKGKRLTTSKVDR